MRKEDLVRYWFTRQSVSEGGDIAIPVYCNGFVATNMGAVGGAVAFVNGYRINPPLVAGANGESFSMGGNLGEVLNEQQLEITFGAGVGLVFITFRFYTNIC